MSENEITICCSNCDLPIGGVFIMDAEAPVVTKMRVKCPFCNDYSFWKNIQGVYSFGGVAMVNPKDERDEIPSTRYVDDIWDGDSVTHIVIREKSDADPAQCRA